MATAQPILSEADPAAQEPDVPVGLIGMYIAALHTNPLLVTMATTAFMNALGDLIAQALERRTDVDWRRTSLLVVWGIFGFAPAALVWYAALEAVFPGQGLASVVGKVLFDQTLWATVAISAMFYFTAVTRGEDHEAAVTKIRETLWPTLKINWCVWPAVQLVNMSAVEPDYRILVILVVQVPWTAYLALQAAAAAPKHEYASMQAQV